MADLSGVRRADCFVTVAGVTLCVCVRVCVGGRAIGVQAPVDESESEPLIVVSFFSFSCFFE